MNVAHEGCAVNAVHSLPRNVDAAADLVAVEQRDVADLDMTAARHPAPATRSPVEHNGNICDAFQFGLLLEETRLKPVLMVAADRSLPARRLRQLCRAGRECRA